MKLVLLYSRVRNQNERNGNAYFIPVNSPSNVN